MFHIGSSDIQIRGSEYQPCSVTVLGTAEQPTIWIDDDAGLPLATLRLSAIDAEALVCAIAGLPALNVCGKAGVTAGRGPC